jgi:hypothetical protein
MDCSVHLTIEHCLVPQDEHALHGRRSKAGMRVLGWTSLRQRELQSEALRPSCCRDLPAIKS